MGQYLSRVEKLLKEAESRGDAARFESLKMIQSELKKNLSSPKPMAEERLLNSLYDSISAQLKQYEDYVTSDHAKARSQYKNDLQVLNELLGS